MLHAQATSEILDCRQATFKVTCVKDRENSGQKLESIKTKLFWTGKTISVDEFIHCCLNKLRKNYFNT